MKDTKSRKTKTKKKQIKNIKSNIKDITNKDVSNDENINPPFECCHITKVSYKGIMQCFIDGEYYKFCNMEKPCPKYINRSKDDI